ncbi:MAG: IS110 family RNA-guided transposase [Thermoleophilia bacterium]
MSVNGINDRKITVGLDVGDRRVHACYLDADGQIVEEAQLAATAQALHRRFGGSDPQRVVLEAGLHSPWMSRILIELGHEVYVANPRRLKAIYQNENKRDKVDAEFLARIGRVDPTLLSPLTHRSAQTQTDLALLRSRAAVVKARALLINYVRGVVKSGGGRIPHCDARSFSRKALGQLPEELVPALSPVVATIAGLDATIRAYDSEIESMAQERYPETELLRQVAGVGPITATTFVLTVEDPTRFPRSRSIGSYLGLRPRLDESGTMKRQLRITKAGDETLRSLLVSCSQYILGHFGPDTDLRRWGLQLAERGGPNGRKRAVVAVARKLSVLLLRLWVTGEVYEPLRNARLRGEPLTA